jgi:hypothetical protein
MDGKWTPKMVSARMEEAVRTLQTLRVRGLKPRGYVSSWPDVIHDLVDALGQDEVKLRLDPPTPEAITRMDEALEWLYLLDKDQSRLVWLHASGMPRKKICAVVGMSPAKAWRMWAAALMTIASAINASKNTLPPRESREEIFIQEYRRTGNASAAYRVAFPCDGLTNDVIHARAKRLARKYQTDGGSSPKMPKTDETDAKGSA